MLVFLYDKSYTPIHLFILFSVFTLITFCLSHNIVDLIRVMQDIQIGDIKPSDDGMEKAFLHTAEFSFKAKEIISVDQFGPNNVNVNAV